MQNWSLDNHPILNKFRSLLQTIKIESDCYYYLFLTPPYANPKEFDPLMYLFYSTKSDPTILHQYPNPKVTLELEENKIRKGKGFNSNSEIYLLLSTPCTCGLNECSHEFSYMLEEMDDDLYNHFPQPTIMKEIHDAYKDSKLSKELLSEKIQNEKLSSKLEEIERVFFTAQINQSNREEFVGIMSKFITEVAQIVFSIPEIKSLPIATKKELNFLVFNAISAGRHYQLLSAYNSAFAKENFIAQENTRNNADGLDVNSTKLKEEEMEEAVKHLRNVLHLPSPAEMIECITKFFDHVVAALPGVEVAADDILPAICFAMTKDVGFGSHVVSFFNYLTDIWPTSGLDEKTTYVLITCSIAASHLSTKRSAPPPQAASPTNANKMPVVDSKQTEDTINLLEDLLNFM